MDWRDEQDDWLEASDYPCCREACIIIYRKGLAWTNCYQGTHKSWEDFAGRGGFGLTDSMLIIGNLQED